MGFICARPKTDQEESKTKEKVPAQEETETEKVVPAE